MGLAREHKAYFETISTGSPSRIPDRIRPFAEAAPVSLALLALASPAAAQQVTPAPLDSGAATTSTTATPPAHRDERRMRLGTGLIVGGTVAAGLGFVVMEHLSSCDDCSSVEPLLGIALLPTSAALLFTGIPFAMLGAVSPRAENPTLAAGGVALTTIGVAAFGGSVTSLAFMSAGSGRTAATIGFAAGGAAALTAGVVMYARGNRSAKQASESSWVAPQVALSPLGGSLRWDF
jgi:hypothetical protein